MNTFHAQYNDYPIKKYFDISSLVSVFEYIYESSHYFEGEIRDFWEFVCIVDGAVNVTSDDRIYALEKIKLFSTVLLNSTAFGQLRGQSPI